ncbi:hypothetical protein [Acinetobacter baumannii]|uniref:hypothetical protein n=1 Tax=Acinetobacter baumannii TaxID=470 RepID=UPI003395ECE6
MRLIDNVLNNPTHPLHPSLSKAISTSNTRAGYKLMFARTETFRKSIIPYLARLLVDRSSVVQHLTECLSG